MGNKAEIGIPATEYNIFKKIYIAYKRQKLFFRAKEAEKNLRKGKVKKATIDNFIKSL